MLRATLFILVAVAHACSNYAMEDEYRLSGRTEDMGPITFDFGLFTRQVGDDGLVGPAKHGYVAFAAIKYSVITLNASTGIKAGLNDAGLSCDKQTLRPTTFPNRSAHVTNVDAALLCRWALEGFGSIAELKEGLTSVNIIAPVADDDFEDGHYALRDASGAGVVLEFVDGIMHVYDDANDGKSGFGVMTNEPSLPWQVEGVKFLQWKLRKAEPAVTMPGSWYPDARFQRLYLVKSTMPRPASYQEAVAQAVHVLNTVTVPMGLQIGKDASTLTDHRTHWGVIYDHVNQIVYWRTDTNQNLQRLRLADAGLAKGQPRQQLLVRSAKLPWFADAAAALGRSF